MKLWNKFIPAVFAALGLLLVTATAFGQLSSVSRYTVTTETGTWVDATSGGTRLGGADDNIWHFTSPFDIVYDSTTIPSGSTFSMTDDGNFDFNNISSNPYYLKWIGGAAYPGAVGVYNQDLIFINSSPAGDYWYVTGSAPNRVLVVEWYQDNPYYNASQVTSFELKIHETSGIIEILYADHSYSYGSSGYIGLNGMSNANTDYVEYGGAFSSTPSADLKFSPPQNKAAQFSLTPKSINFGTLPINDTETYCVTGYSVGNQALAINNYYILGDTNFSIESGPPMGDSVAVGSSVQFCIHFIARASNHSASLVVVTNGRDSGTQIVTLSGGGQTPTISYGATSLFHRVHIMLGDTSATQYITVTSTGQAPVTFNSIYFIGLNPDNYIITHSPPNPLPPGVTDSIGIAFTPTLEGLPDAKLVISTNAFNNPSDTVSLFGIGSLPHLVISLPAGSSGNTLNFDSVAVGDSVCQTIQLTNVGTDTLQILKQIVTYGDYDFSFYPLQGTDTTILPGVSKLLNICFKPLKVGTRLATIRFLTNIPRTFESPRRDTSQFSINVTGVGVPFGQLVLMGSLSDTAEVGKTNCITDTIQNFGQSDLTVTSARIVGPNDSAFTLTGATPPAFLLHPGQRQIVSLCYKASARGSQFDTLLLSGSTSEKSIADTIVLQGVGVEACVSADSMITFGTTGMTMVGSTDSACITVTNCGDIPTTYNATLPAGTAYTLIAPTTSAIVPPGGTAMFCIRFVPTAIGAANTNVTITGGPTPASTILGGVGGGVTASASGSESRPVTIGTCDSFAVTITNNGNVSWTPGTGTIGGPNATDFTITGGPTPATIAPGQTATVMIKFCATQNGTESMTLTFPSASPVPLPVFSYSTSAVGTSEGVTMKDEEAGFFLGASYPNPTTGSAAIMVTLPYDAPVRIDLIDATGAFVKTAYQANLAGGTHMVSIDAKGLASGTYFYQLSSGDVRLTRQLSLVK